MMNGRMAGYLAEGTSALKAQDSPEIAANPIIIAFPQAAPDKEQATGGLADALESMRERVADVLASSELYCSLKYEDFRGCPYGVFTRQGIAAVSSACALLAVAALAFGA